MLITQPFAPNQLRDTITNAYRIDEEECLKTLLPLASFSEADRLHIADTAKQLIMGAREYKKNQGKIEVLLDQYDLSSEEGIALMCLAEALLRIPDTPTMDRLISDKISTADWKTHLRRENPTFINAATWSLILTGKIYAPTLDTEKRLTSTLKRTMSRLGSSVIRPIILQMMKAIGNQFVIGEDIEKALKNAVSLEKMGYRFSYDMLGESARTKEDVEHYFAAYDHAIEAVGQSAKAENTVKNPGISVKLSALNPRFEFQRRDQILEELPPLLLSLAKKAKKYNIGLTIDAEEADRLDLTLDIFEIIFKNPSLAGWEGLGIAVQAYQKRAFFVLDWLASLAKQYEKRIRVRLVKGAYWDAEIKTTQIQGLSDYPVFTRKHSTDVSYLACARKMLSQPACFYSQFGTHNAYCIAAIIQMADAKTDFEFQCLYGMGRAMYDQIVTNSQFKQACCIYAPVGTYKDLLGYLVRRLLENGANTSFINLLADESFPLDKMLVDPAERIRHLKNKRHPKIPLPHYIYGDWLNSQGIDLSNRLELLNLKKIMDEASQKIYQSAPIINGEVRAAKNPNPITSPSNIQETVGYVTEASHADIEDALKIATETFSTWQDHGVLERAAILERAADLIQQAMPHLMALLNKEGGRSVFDCISEIREAIDYCRYYAYRARTDLVPQTLPGPTGELNQLFLHPRGVIACISPWNFPIAIFTGQITAALAAGNAVIAKPAEQTPLVAFQIVQLLHQAGIPTGALQLLPGRGETVGAKLIEDTRVAGVIFTGSTETARSINQTLAKRPGPIGLLIAETGGQNAMIVDSSALLEQTVIDIAQSSFNSAGQRCSALRVLFVQEDVAPLLLNMLKGYMAELIVGDPSQISTDLGPVIDDDAKEMLIKHLEKMNQKAKLIAQVPIPQGSEGRYFAPVAFELPDLGLLKREVFGPILHIIPYAANDLDKVLEAIINTGYGLTLGIQSRIDATNQYITGKMPIGNVYVNRNMIGAVVGVQPFGGEHLSGTGPKAGGPHYLPRLCIERAVSQNTTAVGGNARLVSLLEDDDK